MGDNSLIFRFTVKQRWNIHHIFFCSTVTDTHGTIAAHDGMTTTMQNIRKGKGVDDVSDVVTRDLQRDTAMGIVLTLSAEIGP